MVVLPPETVQFLKSTGFPLKNGSLARLKVIKPLAGNAWQVSIGGKLFAVRSTVPLEPGQLLTTRISFRGNTVTLKIMSGRTGTVSVPPGVEDSGPLNLILQRSALPVNEGVIALLKRAAGGGGFDERLRRMRLAAVLLEKGIEPADELIDELIESLSNRGEDGKDREGDRKRGFPGHGNRDGRGSGEESLRDEGLPEGDDPAREFLEVLRGQFLRTAEPPDHPLQLFNSLDGPKGNWLILPLAVERGGTVIAGSLRLLMNKPETGGWSRGALVVTSGEKTWRFVLEKRSDTVKVKIFYPDGVTSEDLGKTLSDLIEKCEKVAVEIDDKVSKSSVFDGFTSQEPRKNIDTLV